MNDQINKFFSELNTTSDGRVHILKNEHSELSLRQSIAGDAVYLMKIRTSSIHRGQGYASEILSLVCEKADKFRVALFLEVERQDDSNLSEQALADWYWRHGFRGSLQEMIREPSQIDY